MSNLKILLVVPYFERPKMILNGLRAMEKINYDNYEICIVDDGSILYPIEKVIEKHNIKIKNLKIINSKDTLENKAKRGSIHGKFMNQAIKESDADIVIMHSDDDAVHEDYFSNLNSFYLKNPNCMYSYGHVIPFDPFEQVPCETLKYYNANKKWNTNAASGLNWTQPINPFCNVDATQVSWRSQCNKEHNIWLPEEQTKNLDASFYQVMFETFGNCVFNGSTSVFKAFHKDQLTNRQGQDQYLPGDLQEESRYISVCANFKNESKYLKEWLDYHLELGVEHFYLYDNNSTDDYGKILKPYYDKGLITLKKVKTNPAKPKVLEDFMKNHRFQTYWVAFIDCDEFITLRDENNNISNFLKDYEKYPGVGLNWLMFGSSHLETNENNLMIKNFHLCNDPYDHSHNNVSCHIKTIVNPRKSIPQYINPHFFIYDTIFSYPNPALAVDTDKNFITGQNKKVDGELYYYAATDRPKFDKAFIRHYWSKSRSEFIERRLGEEEDDTGGLQYETRQECEKEFDEMNKHFNKLKYKEFIGEI